MRYKRGDLVAFTGYFSVFLTLISLFINKDYFAQCPGSYCFILCVYTKMAN